MVLEELIMEERIKEYYDLLELTYDLAIQKMLDKYGLVKDDYFREASYYRFLKGEIKSISKGKYQRTSEGLYCHHSDEIKWINISNEGFILDQKVPFESQKKENLVYCDLIEHLILHAIIIKETDAEYGYAGYCVFLEPMVREWYIDQKIPSMEWMKNCYNRAFLSVMEADKILNYVNSYLGMVFAYEQRRKADREWREERDRKEREAAAEILRKKEKKRREFEKKYPKFVNQKITVNISRQTILNRLYELKYKNIFEDKKDFKTEMLSTFRDELLEELHNLL